MAGDTSRSQPPWLATLQGAAQYVFPDRWLGPSSAAIGATSALRSISPRAHSTLHWGCLACPGVDLPEPKRSAAVLRRSGKSDDLRQRRLCAGQDGI
jgi:hypothetical protein